ncbi:MAG: 23S rRNA (uridine(2552)-2'-O)-methyltransferase RlmE [Porticoccaceae bacterium]|nr:23S rRNA (uridine(2552)-2'-O)-methyltransferase RlmE [Porticoccaceae bacterium]
MAKSKDRTWIKQHLNDRYVQMSQRDGYRSRASYKLLEILAKDVLIKPGMLVVDLGAAPGGWSQVAAGLVTSSGTVVALDMLPMDSISGVTVLTGDFTDATVFAQLLNLVGERKTDLVISDMAPNVTGVRDVDQPRSMYLVELAAELASNILLPGGSFITKVFQGQGYDEFVRDLRRVFNRVSVRKPDASRAKSREVYVVAKSFIGRERIEDE